MNIKQALWRLVLVALLFVTATGTAWSAIYPGGNTGWLVVASRDNSNSAISLARTFASRHQSVGVFLASNGWFAIALGWAQKSRGESVKQALIADGSIPSDSYFHSGERFIELVWSASGVSGRNHSSILNATQLNLSGGVSSGSQSRRGYVTGLSRTGDNFLSFRSGPSSSNREMLRLGPNVSFDILRRSGRWYNVRLDNGRSGWVFGKYVTLESPRVTVAPPVVKPSKPRVVISDAENGLKLQVSGLSAAGFDYLSLRKGPGSSFLELARLRDKTKLVVTGKSGEWYRVKPAPSVEGWVSREFVVAADVPTFGPEEDSKPETIDIANVATDQSGDATHSNGSANRDTKAVPAQRRVALILGNSKYLHTVALANPKNDADRVGERLKSLGFEVVLGLDLDKSGMESSIRDFVRILPGAHVALFFYAGHAMQVNGQNHLIPIDAKLEDSTAVDFETIKLSSILSFVDQPGRISIALLDACRDNPLSRRFARKVGPTRSAFLGRGLASPSSTGNLLIGFATAPGEVALDGDGANSPFTTALLKHIATPGLEVEAMLKKVRSDVFISTSEQQSPWVNSGLRREFYFKP